MGFFPVNAGICFILFSMKKRSLNTNVEHSVLFYFVFFFSETTKNKLRFSQTN